MSGMDRRQFLSRLAAATAAATAVAALDLQGADIERILWTPGEKTIFLPPAQGWTPQPIVLATEVPQSLRDQWNRENTRHQDWVTMPDGKKHLVHTSASTGIGSADFDIHGNLLRLGGRVITSSEQQADAVASHYQSRGSFDGELYKSALHLSVARRAKTGVYDAPSWKKQKKADFDWRG